LRKYAVKCSSYKDKSFYGPISETIVRPLKLDTVKAFLEVAKHGSFTTAARVLNLTQPAITHQVRELEQRFQTLSSKGPATAFILRLPARNWQNMPGL
jgi:hypothetical protein